MKTLVIATTFPRWVEDTEPSFVFALSECLSRRGHEIIVLAPHAPGAKSHEVQSGLKIVRFRYFYPERWEKLCYEGGIVPKLKSHLLSWVNLPFFLVFQAWAIGHQIRKEKVDLIHVHWLLPQGLFAVFWAFWFRIPIIATAHGSDLSVFGSGVLGRVTRYVMQNSQAITVNSPALKKKVPSALQSRVHLLPMGVDLEVFHPGDQNEARKRLNLASGTILLGVGRLSEQKGFRFLIEALNFVREVFPATRLVLIGEGPEYRTLSKWVKRLNLERAVAFEGAVSQKLLADYYRASDLFIIPSIQTQRGEVEAFGLACAEAMASGIPVIGTQTGGIPFLIENKKSGLLIPEGDPVALAMAIMKILSDDELKRRYADEGISRIQKTFSWEVCVNGFDEIYEQLGKRKV